MARHLTSRELERLLSGTAASSELQSEISHLLECHECWQRSASVAVQRQSKAALSVTRDPLSALLLLLEGEQRHALEILRSRSWWAELRERELEVQIQRLKSVADLRTLSFFRVVLDESTMLGFSDPLQGEQGALLAREIAVALPKHSNPDDLRQDYQGEALTVVANCRRLAADWSGSLAAIKDAKEHLLRGSGDPLRKARLLSIHASLACDTGNLDAALEILTRAARLYRAEEEFDGLAGIVIQEAATLLIAGRADEAMQRAREVLSLGSVNDRLGIIAKCLITESLIVANRTGEALLAYYRNRSLYSKFPDLSLRVSYLEAKLLDSLNYSQEAERLFHYVAEANWAAEQYKESFRLLYALFEMLYRRATYTKAERVCDKAIEMIDLAGNACHGQMREVWQQLREFTRQRTLTSGRLAAMRLYLVRNWSVPAASLPFEEQVALSTPVSAMPRQELELTVVDYHQSVEEDWTSEVTLPVAPGELSASAYLDALDRYDRELILAAFIGCNSEIKPTARFLGISRNSLRHKMKKYNIRDS